MNQHSAVIDKDRIRGHLPAPVINGEEIAFENGRVSDFQGLVTLTLRQVILHTVMHQSSTSTYIPNLIEIEETFCERLYYCQLQSPVTQKLGQKSSPDKL